MNVIAFGIFTVLVIMLIASILGGMVIAIGNLISVAVR